MANHILSNPTSYGNRMQDPRATALSVITEPHTMSHKGWMFHYTQKTLAVVNNASVLYLLKNPAGNYPHLHKMRTSVGNGDVDILLYEAPTTSADGTLQTTYNVNRDSSNASSMEIYLTPTVSVNGALIHEGWAPPTGTGVGNSSGLVGLTEGEEWMLAPATNYLKKITNLSGSTIDIWVEFLWYEIGDS